MGGVGRVSQVLPLHMGKGGDTQCFNVGAQNFSHVAGEWHKMLPPFKNCHAIFHPGFSVCGGGGGGKNRFRPAILRS